jgi:hypothetical protein
MDPGWERGFLLAPKRGLVSMYQGRIEGYDLNFRKEFLRKVVTVCQALYKGTADEKIKTRSNRPCPGQMAQSEGHILFQNVLFVRRL